MGVRRWTFPLILPSGAAGQSLALAQSALRLAARPGGAFLAAKLDGVATADAIRFDVLSGRVVPAYNRHLQRIDRMRMTVELDTQPFGYMPTEILLASAASVGLPGSLAVPGGSVLGDVPGLARLVIIPTVATGFPASPGMWTPDMLAWSLGARASFISYWGAGSLGGGQLPGSTIGEPFVPGSQAQIVSASQNLGAWRTAVGLSLFADGMEPAFRGRHHLYVLMKLIPSQSLPWYVSGDTAANLTNPADALASAALIATLPPAVASGLPGAWGAQPSPAYNVVDLGEITIPHAASGLAGRTLVRVWLSPATSNVGVATPQVLIGGLFLQPLDGGAGVLPRGLAQPTIAEISFRSRLTVDSIEDRSFISPLASADLALKDAFLYYRGQQPYVGASVRQLDLLAGGRKADASSTEPLVWSGPLFGAVSLTYRPRFTFLKGI